MGNTYNQINANANIYTINKNQSLNTILAKMIIKFTEKYLTE